MSVFRKNGRWVEEAERLYVDEGLSLTEVAARIPEVGRSTIRLALLDRGVVMRSKGTESPRPVTAVPKPSVQPGYAHIPLMRRGVAEAWTIIDAADEGLVRPFVWRLSSKGYAFAAIKLDGTWTNMFMHRYLLGLEAGNPRQGDHINFNRLDNRRANLRVVTGDENRKRRRPYSEWKVAA